jgi:3'-phosphoadenosine 5'-phosphosulfate sulfotransferase (PAPS reductase)/FAD synthetase
MMMPNPFANMTSQWSFDLCVPQQIPPEIPDLIRRGALFIVNHSAGKDSQAMMIELRSIVPASQIVVVHAELPEVEWDGSREHIEATCQNFPIYYVMANKTLLGMVEARGMFPSPQYRQCTSDLKRGPITKLIRKLVRETGNSLIVNCIGLRAEESPGRKKQIPFKLDTKNSVAGREWYTWLPIHAMLEWQVFAAIDAAGEKSHWVYEAGMTRKSCSLCIMSSVQDLKTAARLRPALYERYVRLERRIGQTMLMPVNGRRRFLDEVVGIPVAA